MEKKIIAIAVAAVLLVVGLTACKSNAPTIETDAGEYLLATDEEGNTMINRDGKLIICVTDEYGKVVKDSNGEIMTNAVDFPDYITSPDGRTAETPVIRWNLPEGWTFGSNTSTPTATKDGTDEGVYIKLIPMTSAREKSRDYIVSETVAVYTEQMPTVVEKYPNSKLTVEEDVMIFNGTIEATRVAVKIEAEDGTVINYADGYYYEFAGKVYKIEFCAQQGYYDESFDVHTLINCLEMKDVLTYTTDPNKA